MGRVVFLAELEATRPLVPRLLAADAAEKLIIMTDLADRGVQLIGDLLFTEAAGDRTEEALTSAQAALGRLNAAGTDQQRRYDQIKAKRPSAQVSRHAVNKLDDMLAGLPQVFGKLLRRSVSKHVDDEIHAARSCLFEPGPFNTITHGDPTVGNLFFSPAQGVKFLDLETVGYRHALLDGSFARLRYIHSAWAHHIPIDLQKRLLATYRTELAKGCPQAGDDLAFGQALVAACAAWFAALCSHLHRVADHDIRWDAPATANASTSLDHFIAVADEYRHMPAVRNAAADVERQLRNTWRTTERQLPTYPALANSIT